MPALVPGTLLPLAVERTRQALQRGALRPIETVSERIEQGGVNFVVRMASGLWRKETASAGNPFLPYDEALFVADMSDTHVCLLNKFNVIGHHLLMVTRRFEGQELPLTRDDFSVLLTALREVDGLAFYNSGVVAGASQPHRHLQLVTLPMVPEGGLPVGPLIRGALGCDGPSSGLPFRHAVARLPERWWEENATAEIHGCYARLLATAGVTEGAPPDPSEPLPAYNLLATREWMLLVPRSRERWQGISINALGFAGSLFVRDPRQLEAIRAAGPMTALCGVAVPEVS